MTYLRLAALALAGAASSATAGPPYLTDDPIPTDVGHWEIYAFAAGDGLHSTIDADIGLDLNYGPVEGVQLTTTLPLSFSHEPSEGWLSGSGDVEFGAKYRFFKDKKHGLSASVFPRAILPTSSIATREKTRVLLPLWVGKDFSDGTSLFGGGGYELNPGPGNRNFWQTAVAVTHRLNSKASIGAEIVRQSPDVVGGTAQTHAGLGGIVQLGGPFSLLFSGGPTWADNRTGYHFYSGLGLNL